MIEFMELFSRPETYLSLLTLAVMEIILGIDNIVFITILCGKLPEEYEHKIRRIGIALALVSRLGLLFAINLVMGLTENINIFDVELPFSGRGAILMGGGLFLIMKATHEIYEEVEIDEEEEVSLDGDKAVSEKSAKGAVAAILAQVIVMDIVFSLDSVITAVGMVDEIEIMVVAMIIAVGVMIIFANPVGDFVQNNASVRVLALSFLVLIGTMLVMEGAGQHVNKGYIYAAMGFSLMVEFVNLRRMKKRKKKA